MRADSYVRLGIGPSREYGPAEGRAPLLFVDVDVGGKIRDLREVSPAIFSSA